MKINLNVIIPAAGMGSRFYNSEFKALKPFIKFSDKTMLEWVLEGFKSKKYNIKYYIILNSKTEEEYPEDILKMKNNYNVDFLFINLLTEGPTTTALFLYDVLNSDTPTMIANCDQIVDIDFDDYLEQHFSSNADGSMLIFEEKEKSSKWSYVELDSNNFIKSVRVKDPFSSFAVVGWYFYSKGKYFLKSATYQIINQDKANNEYFCCPTFNYLISWNKKVKGIIIKNNQMHGVGVPDDLRKYLKNITNS
ncbi:MAG: sugar phosphate nucleotidyltransferase [Metamycoplasmataceae bacterium]